VDERRIRRYGSQSARWDAEFWQYHHVIVGYLEYHCLILLRDHLELSHSADELHDEVLEPLIRRRYLIAKMGLEDLLKDRNMSRVFPELSDVVLPRLEDMLLYIRVFGLPER
jgi:hypothetical protein